MNSTEKKLFGTDGIRGRAGVFPLDEATVRIIGDSLARQLNEKLGRPARIITGRDTRESGPLIEQAFQSGAAASGADCRTAGVITTPGVAFLAKHYDFDAGVVISASHNHFEDNGIKIFAPSGRKMDEATERAIEADIFSAAEAPPAPAVNAGLSVENGHEFRDAYLADLEAGFSELDLSGIRIVADCANGAASELAPKLLANLGADVLAINDRPDGRNINLDCGSLHLDGLRQRVASGNADIGVAFDGDADRALFVDEKGSVVDGDGTLWIMAQALDDAGQLGNKTVVATVMSNIGLELALASRGLKLLRTQVGDKYVLDELVKTGSALGGEQSGHIIFPHRSLVGDGMLTTLCLLEAIRSRNVHLSQALAGFTRFPQVLLNVRVREKKPFESVAEIASAAREVESQLNGSGRLLLRYSGTENLARVMIEGKNQAEIEDQARKLAGVIETRLG